MIARRAGIGDAEQALPLIEAFFEESLKRFGVSFDKERVLDVCKLFAGDHLGFVLSDNGVIVGILAGMLSPYFLDPRSTVFQEVAWYVKPEARPYGRKLLQALESHCKHIGVNMIIMVGLRGSKSEGERFDRFYQLNGYIPQETHYLKCLK